MIRLTLLALVFAAVPAWAQPDEGEQLDRRDRREPSIILNTGGRTGTCDVLKFTPDGTELLGAGDDKVVTGYRVGDKGIDEKSVRFLRWPSWREQRGSIFAMDVSPDGKYVAVGGYGLINSCVAVMDRTLPDTNQNRIVHLAKLEQGDQNFFAVMSLAFSPNGQQLAAGTGNGYVWIWDFKAEPKVIGYHPLPNNTQFNRVRAVRFEDENTVVSLAEDGQVAKWTRAGDKWPGAVALELKGQHSIRTAAFNRNGWVAAGELGPTLRVSSPDGKVRETTAFKRGEFPRSLAFNGDGTRLAVGVGRLSAFGVEGDDVVHLYTIGADGVRHSGQFAHRGRVEALAWKGEQLAVAGGDNHDVALWNTSPIKLINSVHGLGHGLWGVALSTDGRYLAFNDQRDANASDPNRRGKGDARFFDLRRRRFEKQQPAKTELLKPLETCEGWSVRPDDNLPAVWHAVHQSGQSHPLDVDRDRDGRPTCYTFLKPADGHGVRLAIGHYWGFSLFELQNGTFKRTRLYTGHHGEVSAICPAEGGKWLVTASPDQTVAGWSLADWPSKTIFGGTFTALPNSVRVDKVDTGSPAWEAGLVPGDEIVKLGVGGKWFFRQGELGNPVAAKGALDQPEPGKELFLFIRRAGREKEIRSPSTVRTRPLWRFLPGPDREWVLWAWQGSYYDTTTSGDSLAGFLMNDPSMKKEPRFYKLEQFRDAFQREDVIDELTSESRDVAKGLEIALGTNPVAVNLGLNEPPALQIQVPTDIIDKPTPARLIASPRSENIDFQPQRVELWINEFRAESWKPEGKAFDATFRIEPGMLRSGPNKLTLMAFNRLGGRSEATRTVTNPAKNESRTLLGMGVGINDYSSTPSVGGKRAFGNLKGPVSDVTMQSEAWSSQKGKLFQDATFTLKPDKKATREDIIAELDRLATVAKPDDLLLVVLAGHGDFRTTPGPKPKKPTTTFYFCCPDYDPKRPAETGIDHSTLYEKLARIRCRKLVLLDACHSGEAAFNPVRSLTPGGQGPTILAACDRSELAYEHPEKHNGLFTMAILKALGDGFKDADTNNDGQLDSRELIDSVRKRMPELLRDAKLADDLQNPQSFPRQPESFPLYRK